MHAIERLGSRMNPLFLIRCPVKEVHLSGWDKESNVEIIHNVSESLSFWGGHVP